MPLTDILTKRKPGRKTTKVAKSLNKKEKLSIEEVKKRIRESFLRYQKTPKGKYATYRQVSIQRKMEFALTFGEFQKLLNQKCHYCGQLGVASNGIGIDRVDNSVGYIIGNVVSSCHVCNFMKSNHSLFTFLKQIKLIYNFNIAKHL